MDYDDWLNAVNAALLAQGKHFGWKNVQPSDLLQAFQSGASPVLFGQGINAPNYFVAAAPRRRFSLTLPDPNRTTLAFLYHVFNFVGWTIWIAGLFWSFIILLFVLFAAFAPKDAKTQSEAANNIAFIPQMVAFGVLGFVYALLIVAIAGGFWILVAQSIALVSRIEENTRP